MHKQWIPDSLFPPSAWGKARLVHSLNHAKSTSSSRPHILTVMILIVVAVSPLHSHPPLTQQWLSVPPEVSMTFYSTSYVTVFLHWPVLYMPNPLFLKTLKRRLAIRRLVALKEVWLYWTVSKPNLKQNLQILLGLLTSLSQNLTSDHKLNSSSRTTVSYFELNVRY